MQEPPDATTSGGILISHVEAIECFLLKLCSASATCASLAYSAAESVVAEHHGM
jgi:hypothetical protein